MTEQKQEQQEQQAAKGVERKSYKLKRPHMHRGILNPVGAKVDLTPRQAERLSKGDNPKI